MGEAAIHGPAIAAPSRHETLAAPSRPCYVAITISFAPSPGRETAWRGG